MESQVPSILFVSSGEAPWGGNEELWARAALTLRPGIDCHLGLVKGPLDLEHPLLRRLTDAGCRTFDVSDVRPRNTVQRMLGNAGTANERAAFRQVLEAFRPDLVLVSQGINFDGIRYAEWAHETGRGYALISNKAVSSYWPPATDRDGMGVILQHARRLFFVSHANRVLTEEQFGQRFANAEVIWNAVTTPVAPLPYPPTDRGWRLACIGRQFVLDKGQDILMRVLARPHWRERPLHVSVIGDGVDRAGLEQLKLLFALDSVSLHAHRPDVAAIFASHHGLILPSRHEGMPLVLLEAMASGRMAISSDVGGAPEVIDHGVTGFLCKAHEDDLDAVLETAWQRRNEWREMGLAAYSRFRERVPEAPEVEFARRLLECAVVRTGAKAA